MTTRTQTTGVSRPTQPRFPTSSEAFGEDFVLTLWTDDPALARSADAAGVQRVGLDLERLGKAERQHGLGTWISPHHIGQLPALGAVLQRARLFARCNPLHRESAEEVGTLLAHGVQVLMLPMFEGPQDLERFVEMVDGRAAIVALLETRSAAERIEQVVAVEGIGEIHLGINDLALSLGARTRFEVLKSPLVEHIAASVTAAGLRLGIGALGRIGDRTLPIDPDLIYARIVGLGARGALIARSYAPSASSASELRAELERSRERLTWWHAAGAERHERARERLAGMLAACPSW